MGQRWPIVCLHLEPIMIFADFLWLPQICWDSGEINFQVWLGQHWPIVCLHLEPVVIFAVPINLHFLIEKTQHLMGKCLPPLQIALVIRRVKLYTVKLFQNIIIIGNEQWEIKMYSSLEMYREVRHSKNIMFLFLNRSSLGVWILQTKIPWL